MLSKYRNLEHEFESLRNQLEDEMVSKESVRRKTEAAAEEVAAGRRRFEASTSRAEELDTAKLRLQARLAEADSFLGAKIHKPDEETNTGPAKDTKKAVESIPDGDPAPPDDDAQVSAETVADRRRRGEGMP